MCLYITWIFTCSLEHYAEHEITGDVLLELDVGILKEELNITAFGKRIRIANAILELRRPASFSSDPTAFHNGFTGGAPQPGIADAYANAHRQEASSVASGEARSQGLMPTPGSQVSGFHAWFLHIRRYLFVMLNWF